MKQIKAVEWTIRYSHGNQFIQQGTQGPLQLHFSMRGRSENSQANTWPILDQLADWQQLGENDKGEVSCHLGFEVVEELFAGLEGQETSLKWIK